MKIVSLNLWGGIVYEPLMEFLARHREDTDVFCFQEMFFGEKDGVTEEDKARINLFSKVKEHLPGFEPFTYLAPEEARWFQGSSLPENVRVGQAIFVKENKNVTADGGLRCYETLPGDTDFGGKVTGNCMWVTLENNTTILNVHGLWQKGTQKKDTVARLMQSHIIQKCMQGKEGEKVLCGDFNLSPDGESITILEQGMENLITTHKVTSTRSSFYEKEDKFSDYMFVSPGLSVKTFQVLQDEVSDHLPLLLEI